MRIKASFARLVDRVRRFFRAKASAGDGSGGVVDADKLQKMEAERLDRLRNPSNYRGR
jgi:hypothetical protein